LTLRYLLDTNVLSEPISKIPNKKLMRKLDEHAAESATAAPVLHELRYGSKLLEPSRRRLAIDRYIDEVVLRLYPVLAYDPAAAEWHAEERARLTKAGKAPPFLDGLIAAIAKVNSLVLVTSNLKDFRAFQGLSLETWKT
jgi:tRNA(fMet)-specific endonuclease VapC